MRTLGAAIFLAMAIVATSGPPAAAGWPPTVLGLPHLPRAHSEPAKWHSLPFSAPSEAPRVHLAVTKQQLAKVLADAERQPYITVPAFVATGLGITDGRAVQARGVKSIVFGAHERMRQMHTLLRLIRPEGGFRVEPPVGQDYIVLTFKNRTSDYAFLTTTDLKLRAATKWQGTGDAPGTEPLGAESETLFQAELTYWTETIAQADAMDRR